MLIRRKRKKPTRKLGRHAQPDSSTGESTGSVSSFIQSALSSTERHARKEQPEAVQTRPPGSGKKPRVGSRSKKTIPSISAKKSISGARKKLKLGESILE